MKRHKKKISANRAVFTYLIAFVLLLATVLWLFQVVFLDDVYKHTKEQEIKLVSNAVAENFNSDEIEEYVESSKIRRDISVTAINKDGEIVLSNDRAFKDKLSPRFDKKTYDTVIEKLKKSGTATYYFDEEIDFSRFAPGIMPMQGGAPVIERKNENNLVYGRIVKNRQGEDIVLLTYSMITPINATVNTLKHEFIFILVFLLVFSAITAWLISRKFARPLANMSKSAKILATGNYDVVFDGKGVSEIEELSETLNNATSELSKLDGFRQELVANVSHDLRTPLTMITGYAEVMRDIPGENTPENVQIIIDESNRLKNLVNDIMDVSKFNSGEMVLSCKRFCITEMIDDILERYNKLCEQEGLSIEFAHDKKCFVYGDEAKISQVIYNLINNAIHYCGEDKKVIISQTVEEDTVKIEIIDHGQGISDDDLPYIWDRYFKSKLIHKRAVVGTGLGLSIVKKILELHEAEYGVESEENVGSDFWFKLKIV